jgi:sorting nexin-29
MLWHEAHVISLFKEGKQNLCCNYRGISHLNTGYKIYTKILNTHLQTITEVILLENLSGFRKGRSCIDNIFALNQITEKRREFNLEMHIAFIDLEKAFDRINRRKQKLWLFKENTQFDKK